MSRRAPVEKGYRLPLGLESGLRDTAFARNREEPVHRWVPWIAGFSSTFVDGVLSRLQCDPGDATVLDPFAGVGTTLVAAMLGGYHTVGFEINPYAALACRVKLSWARFDVASLRERADDLCAFLTDRVGDAAAQPRSQPPTGFRSRVRFFSPLVERQVLFALDYIAQVREPWVQDLLRVALGAVMVSFSNYTYEPSLGTRQGAGKPPVENADVAAAIAGKLAQIAEDMGWLQTRMATLDYVPRATIYHESYAAAEQRMGAGTVDCVVTSPPYLNNYHYVRNTRPQLYWLGLVSASPDLHSLEQTSFGKFWQTVRGGPRVALEVEDPEITALLSALEDTNHREGPYGGPGWANYAATYFNDCARFCQAMLKVMKPEGQMVVVIGNNILQGIVIPTDRLLAKIAHQTGFVLEGIHQVRKKRTGSSIVNSAVRVAQVRERVELYESAVVLRAPG